ncbi:ABC transporter substrate-binding protein, partial [Cupriavidus pinatubonensis]
MWFGVLAAFIVAGAPFAAQAVSPAVASAPPATARAISFPARPMRLIVPF